jgi:hypothetical protein
MKTGATVKPTVARSQGLCFNRFRPLRGENGNCALVSDYGEFLVLKIIGKYVRNIRRAERHNIRCAFF